MISNLGAIPLTTVSSTKNTTGPGDPAISAPGVGYRVVIVGLLIQLLSAATGENTVIAKSGTTAKMTLYLKEKPQGLFGMIPDKYKWIMGANEAFFLDAATTQPFTYTIWYYVEEVPSTMT